MKKETFNYLYSFKYHNTDYVYLISKNYPFYFLEYDYTNDSFSYPDLDTFKELYYKFCKDNEQLFFDVKSSVRRIKKIICEKNITFTPLVKAASGLISLGIALSMCGCIQTSYPEKHNQESSLVSELSIKEQGIHNYFESYHVDVIERKYNDTDYIFVRKFINSSNKQQVTLQDFNEFRKYCHLEFIPTWDDVIRAFQENTNIDNNQKILILKGINNLRKNEEIKDLDLSVLYINAQKMTFQYLSSEEISGDTNHDSAYAYFDVASKVIYLPNDKPLKKFEFIHEVLGHGSLAFRDETEDTLTVFDCTNYIMLPNNKRYTGYSMGQMVSEGGANMLARFATNDYKTSTFYQLYEEELRVIAKFCHVSIGELFNHKGISLYDLMYKNKINAPVEYIFKMDGLMKGQLYCEFSDLMERLFIDATEEEIFNSDKSRQYEIVRDTIQIIRNSYFKNQKELVFTYNNGDGVIRYNFDESADKYGEDINKTINK